MNNLWVDAKNNFLNLDNSLKIKWLASFANYLTIEFRVVFHEEKDVNIRLEKLYAINEIFHQIYPQIARNTQGVNSYPDDKFLDYLYVSTSSLNISMFGFFRDINNIMDLNYT